MSTYELKIEDSTRMRFVKIKAKDSIDALLQAIKETGILNPTNVFQKQKNGRFEIFNF